MMAVTLDELRYPVGRFAPILPATAAVRRAAIDEIAALPARLRAAVEGLDDRQLGTPYRADGWTVRQVVHHVADSHMQGFWRLKLALTEDHPTIKPYDEQAFATLPDMALPIGISLDLLAQLHARWVAVYQGLNDAQFERGFFHPEPGETQSVDRHLQLYAWHSRHHVAHITTLRQRQGW
jgi:DinB family protein